MRRFLPIVLLLALPLFAANADSASERNPREIYRAQLSQKMVPLLTGAIQFPTIKDNAQARQDQQAWLHRVGSELGLIVRDAGPITEVELSGPENAPVLGLIVHGDVQPVSAEEWTTPPFAATVKDGWIYGRGVADDKGPLVQALLAMKALQLSGANRTHTIRLLVGSDEESDNLDVTEYLKTHQAPYLTLVLDCLFPVVVGEKAWVEFDQFAADPYRVRGNSSGSFSITQLNAGISTSIVPSRAEVTLHWLPESDAALAGVVAKLKQTKASNGITYDVARSGRDVQIVVHGFATHAGMNLPGGRNALVLLANMLHGYTAPSGANDLLEFAREAGADLHGNGLGIEQSDPIWGGEDVNVATILPDGDKLKEAINIRHIPPRPVSELRAQLEKRLAEFNARMGASLTSDGFFKDEVLKFNLDSKVVKRLLADYREATGDNSKPAVSGGGTYAKRLPNSIAFGMWFNGKPYSGHVSNEGIPIADLHRGVDILLVTLLDLTTKPPMDKPFEP